MKLSKPAWWCVIAIEVLLICACCLIYRKKEPIELSFTQDDLIYESGESGFYLDSSYDHLYIETPEFNLPKGYYTVEAEYERSDNFLATALEVQYEGHRYDGEYTRETYNNALSGRIILIDPHNASCDFRVKYDDWPMQVRGYLTDEWEHDPYILIRNIRIVSSPVTARHSMFCLAIFFLAADLLLLLYSNKDKFQFGDESKKHIKVLAFLILTTSIPLMMDYLFITHDLKFHLTRIEGIKEGLLYGMFPVRIQPGWLNGHGYAASIFYGDLFLYISAALRIVGVSLQDSYKFYIFLVNTATVLIAYYCFRRMSNAKTGLVCTVVYTLNIYRLVCIYTRGAVGEYTAMVFLPLVLYGFWKIYMLPEESKEHKNSWATVSAGCCGIFVSHMISTEMTAFFAMLAAIILWRKTFRKKTFFVLCKSVAVTVLLTCWFLIPFMDYMLTESFLLHSKIGYSPYMLEDRSVFISQFFMTDFSVADASYSFLDGLNNEMPLTPGLSALSALAFWVFLCVGKKEREKEERKTEYFAVFLCLLSLMMTTWLFPYTWLVSKVPALSRSISSIQYPWRFFTVAGIMLAYLVCVILKKEWIEVNKKKLFIAMLFGLSFGQGLSYMGKCLHEYTPYRAYQESNLSTYDLMGAEYLPMDASSEGYVDDLTLCSDAVAVADWYRDHGAVVVFLTNNGAEPAQVEVPLLLYKGYHAISGSGEELEISKGASGCISVSVPAGFAGNFKVEFKEPWYWRMSELISLTTLLCLVLYPCIKNHVQKSGKRILFMKFSS